MNSAATQDIGDLYADISACILAIKNLLVAKGLVTHDEFVEAFQERALVLAAAKHASPLHVLRSVATGEMPRESDL